MAITDCSKRLPRRFALLAPVGLLLTGSCFAAYRALAPEQERVSVNLAALALQDQNGKPFDYQRLAGKPVALFFGFTHCPDVCPLTLQRLARLREVIGARFDEIEVIFVTLDPERDTAEQLKGYLGAQPIRVTGLTGSQVAILHTASHFGVFREKVLTSEKDYTIDHTAALFLIGRYGAKAGQIPFDASDAEFESKLRSLL
ncbi:SCO family protein [Novosphingobium sp. MW5]|nr:SCO family protein [Novosphingobium sp. MW5]